ncbi:hypothetical protein GJ496_005321 [Pomphorhynchus laevis]|nr:hypothetical protein GJ496_005321 [Pomphorhynchus laevis]
MNFSFLNKSSSVVASTSTASTTPRFSFGGTTTSVAATPTTASGTTGFSGFRFASPSVVSQPVSTSASLPSTATFSFNTTPSNVPATTESKLTIAANYSLGGASGKLAEQSCMDTLLADELNNAREVFLKTLEEQNSLKAECANMLLTPLNLHDQLLTESTSVKQAFYKDLKSTQMLKQHEISGQSQHQFFSSTNRSEIISKFLNDALNENEQRFKQACITLESLEKKLTGGLSAEVIAKDIIRAIQTVHKKLAYLSAFVGVQEK